jgi:hypothetical protein
VATIFYYSLHGRLLASDCELPLLSTEVPGDAEMFLRLCAPRVATPPAAAPWYRGELLDADGQPSIAIEKCADGDLVVRFADGTAFLVDSGGRAITLRSAPDAYTLGDIAAYALGPVAAVALHLHGAVLLHASAVAVRGKAVLFAGHGRAGKSTTAAILHRLGYPFLADDIVEIRDTNPYSIGVAPPAMRLWPDVAGALFGSSADGGNYAPSWDKKIVRAEPVKPDATEIAAILFLDAGQRGAAARLQRLSPRQGWERLMAHAHTVRLPGAPMALKIFEVTSALAGSAAMFAFTPPSIESSDTLGTFLKRELDELFR